MVFEIFAGQVHITQDLVDEARAQRLLSVNGNGRFPTVRVSKPMVTALDSHNLESLIQQGLDKLFPCPARPLAHM